MMPEVGRKLEVPEVSALRPEGYTKIKPEGNIQIEEAKNFWDNLFNDTQETDNSNESFNLDIQNKEGLTKENKEIIKRETGWSDAIIDYIKSMEEYDKVYKDAGLYEGEIHGKKCLLKNIDLDYVDKKTGMTNRELMERGHSAIDSKTGERIELHHMGQGFDSPLAELCADSEHGGSNHRILHPKTSDSWRKDSHLKNQYQYEKRNHWKTRAQEE